MAGGDGADVGAFERGPNAEFTVTNTNDNGAGSLRRAITEANIAGIAAITDAIPFAPSASGTINLAGSVPI